MNKHLRLLLIFAVVAFSHETKACVEEKTMYYYTLEIIPHDAWPISCKGVSESNNSFRFASYTKKKILSHFYKRNYYISDFYFELLKRARHSHMFDERQVLNKYNLFCQELDNKSYMQTGYLKTGEFFSFKMCMVHGLFEEHSLQNLTPLSVEPDITYIRKGHSIYYSLINIIEVTAPE